MSLAMVLVILTVASFGSNKTQSNVNKQGYSYRIYQAVQEHDWSSSPAFDNELMGFSILPLTAMLSLRQL